jgi:hypothetical protein
MDFGGILEKFGGASPTLQKSERSGVLYGNHIYIVRRKENGSKAVDYIYSPLFAFYWLCQGTYAL